MAFRITLRLRELLNKANTTHQHLALTKLSFVVAMECIRPQEINHPNK